MAAKLAVQYPESNGWIPACGTSPLLADSTGAVRSHLLLLLGAALCVLGVGCANLSNLSLARASTRTKEFALRAALGAGRGRIIRQLLTESLLLGAIGGLVGSLAAFGGTRYIVALLPPEFPRAYEIMPDLRVLLFCGTVTLVTTCLFGFAPAWRCARGDLAARLNESGRESRSGAKGGRARNLLVVCEIVLTFVLLACAALLLRGLWHLEKVPIGFNAKNLLTFQLALAPRNIADEPARVATFYAQLLQRVKSMDEVESASITSSLPLIGRRWGTDLQFPGKALPVTKRPRAFACIIGADYFRSMGIALLRGRDFNTNDRHGAPEVAIINQALARLHFPNQNPIGQRITPRLFYNAGGVVEREIVGVVASMKFDGLDYMGDEPGIFIPHAQSLEPNMRLVVRSALPTEILFPRLRAVVQRLEPDVFLFEPETMEEHLETVVAQPRLNSTLLAAYAGMAVLLTGIGVYGVTAYSVSQRRHEIGLRIALGATPRVVFRFVMGQALRNLGWAIPIGVFCALLAMRFLHFAIEGAETSEVLIIPIVAVFVAAVALAGSWLPAARATKVDPLIALRCE